MPNLIEIGEAGLRLQEILYEAEGELTPDTEALLDSILADGKEALDGAAWVLRAMEADADFLKSEAKRFTDRAKSIEAQRENLRARMGFLIDSTFSGKVKTEKNTLWMQSSPDTLQVELAPDADLHKIAADNSEFVKTTLALDNTAVKNRYLAGDVIPSAITVTPQPGKRSLRMR
jgi:hypothetical protein